MTEFNSKIKQNSRILKIFLFSICALFACAINAHAQSLVQGTVTDETGESLPGVSVVVKGTTNGTVTDVNGKYSIQATSKDILSFTYVGMAELDIKVAGQKTINVVMKDDVASLDEVIVAVSYTHLCRRPVPYVLCHILSVHNPHWSQWRLLLKDRR